MSSDDFQLSSPFNDADLLQQAPTSHSAIRAGFGALQTDQENPAAWAHWALDRIDEGLLMLDADGRIRYANRVAKEIAAASDAFDLSSGRLAAHRPSDDRSLREALAQVSRHGGCRLLAIGVETAFEFLALVGGEDSAYGRIVLCAMGRRDAGNALTIQWYAQSFGLTRAETDVLRLLCAGLEPATVAEIQGVAMSTVRSQIGAIRSKTGAGSIRELLLSLAKLPALCGAVTSPLHRAAAAAQPPQLGIVQERQLCTHEVREADNRIEHTLERTL